MLLHLKRKLRSWVLKEDHSPVSHKQVFLNWGKIKHSDQIDRFGVLIPTSGESLAKYHVFPVHRQWLVIGVFNGGTCEHLTIQISTCYYRHAIFTRTNMKTLAGIQEAGIHWCMEKLESWKKVMAWQAEDKLYWLIKYSFFIEPRYPWSDLWVLVSLSDSKILCRKLTGVTLADEDTSSSGVLFSWRDYSS